MGALIRPKTSPRLPLTPDDAAYNAMLDQRISEMMQERQAKTMRKAERQLAAIRRAEAKRAKTKTAGKARKLPKPYRGKAKPARRGDSGSGKQRQRRTVTVPLPHHAGG